MTGTVTTIISPRWILPVVPAGQLLENHSLLVAGQRIEAIIPTPEPDAITAACNHVELPGHLLMPGLVNAHTHAAMSLLRGLADDLPLMTWLQEHIWPAEKRWVNAQFVADGSALAAAEMIRCGTTCFSDMYFFPDTTAEVCIAAGLRACVGMIVVDFPTVWADNADQYIDKGIALRDRFDGEALVSLAWAPHAPYTVSDEPLRRIARLADRYRCPVHIHLHESAHEVEQALRDHGQRPLARLQQLGLVDDRLVAVHMTQLEDAEIELLARARSHVVHCPESNLKLASGFAPVSELLDGGVDCCLGTDGCASNNDLDMLGEMRTAALLAKGRSGDASALPAEQVVRMATLGGANALGLGQQIGSLEPGKLADIIAVDLDRAETSPVYNPVSQLVYASSREQVTDVWVAGRRLMAERELQTIDLTETVERAQHWGRNIAKL